MSTAIHIVPPHADDGPLPSVLENEVFNEPEARRERSRSPVRERAAASSSRRVSVAEPEAERTPTRRSTRDTTDDLPMTKHKHPLLCAVELINRVLMKEQVEHQRELKDLPGNLDYRRESPTVQNYIDGSRQKAWKKYEDLRERNCRTGRHVPIPSGWIQSRISTKSINPTMFQNSRRGWYRGQLRRCRRRTYRRPNFRHRDTRARCSACRVPRCTAVFVGHLKNAYFQAMPIDRIVIMRQPQGGLPGVDPDAFLLIRVPVYGLCDSGRGFWKKVDHDAKEVGLLSSRIFTAFYFHIENGAVDVVLTTHVDDFLWACTESGHAVVDRLLTRFEVGRKEEGRLRFCGKQFDALGHGILLDVEDNTRKTTYIEIAKHRNPADPVTKGEKSSQEVLLVV